MEIQQCRGAVLTGAPGPVRIHTARPLVRSTAKFSDASGKSLEGARKADRLENSTHV